MLSVLLWMLCGIGILCIIVFCGKRKGTLPESDREVMISEAVCNIAAVTLILTQLLFPIYGYVMFPARGLSIAYADDFEKRLVSVLTELNVNYLKPFNIFRGNSVYSYVILTFIFCFFAGMYLYKFGLKLKHKKFLFIPLLTMVIAVVKVFIQTAENKSRVRNFPKYQIIMLTDCSERYLLGSFIMIAALYGIYLLIRKLTHKEIIALIVILVLSFFAPTVIVLNDGLKASEPVIKYLYFGPGIPLFPIGMIVMKYKDKLLPKTKKGVLIHAVSWLFAGGIAYYILFEIQYYLAERAGVYLSDAHSCIDNDEFRRRWAILREIYKTSAFPWLVIGLAAAMVILSLALLIRTGNPVTKFFREHAYLITVLLFSRHVYFELSNYDNALWTEVFKMPEELFVIVPFIYFGLSVALAYLIKRFILDKVKNI